MQLRLAFGIAVIAVVFIVFLNYWLKYLKIYGNEKKRSDNYLKKMKFPRAINEYNLFKDLQELSLKERTHKKFDVEGLVVFERHLQTEMEKRAMYSIELLYQYGYSMDEVALLRSLKNVVELRVLNSVGIFSSCKVYSDAVKFHHAKNKTYVFIKIGWQWDKKPMLVEDCKINLSFDKKFRVVDKWIFKNSITVEYIDEESIIKETIQVEDDSDGNGMSKAFRYEKYYGKILSPSWAKRGYGTLCIEADGYVDEFKFKFEFVHDISILLKAYKHLNIPKKLDNSECLYATEKIIRFGRKRG